LFRVGGRHSNNVTGLPADAAFERKHQLGLPAKIHAAQRVAGMLRMALPDHRFYIVLEKQAAAKIRKVRRWNQEIDDSAIETFLMQQLFEKIAQARRGETADRERKR
jgi:hypothetical protein